MQLAGKAQDLINVIPKMTFFEFMDKIKSEPYGGDEEFEEIRSRLPQDILDNDAKCGVASADCVIE